MSKNNTKMCKRQKNVKPQIKKKNDRSKDFEFAKK